MTINATVHSRESVIELLYNLIEDKTGVVNIELEDDLELELDLEYLDIEDIVTDLEIGFNVVIDPEQIDEMVTVGDILDAVLDQL